MVSGGFDVTSLRSCDELPAAITAEMESEGGSVNEGRMIVLIDLDEPTIAATLRVITMQHPTLGIIARTRRGPIDAEVMLSAVDLDRSVIVERTASEAELVDAARRIAPKLYEAF
jgi:hypothetical protein